MDLISVRPAFVAVTTRIPTHIPGLGIIAVALVLLAWQSPARADHAELFAGGWKYDIDGTFATGDTALSVNNLNVRSQGQLNLVFDYQPDGNWLPDIGASYDHIGATSNVISDQDLQFGPITIIGGETRVATRVHFDDYELNIEAPFYLFGIRTGVGVTVARLIGSAQLTSSDSINVASTVTVPLPGTDPAIPSVRENINELVPMAHLRFQGNITSWLGITVSGGYIAAGGEHLGEFRAVLDVKPIKWVALTAGYQGKLYKVNDQGFVLDTRLTGVVFGLTAILP